MQTSTKFKKKIISAAVHAACYSIVLSHTTMVPLVHAAPTGGDLIGGNGAITQSGTNTTINQTSQNMAINWQSYNVNANERVQYLQPNASSISLNRILSNNGSIIAGRIDANGQVILVNPNGVFFTPTSVLNVGGIIASGLDIKPTDFMNGNYIFNAIPGTEGKVVNSGTINASLGGNVALLGKQVENNGLIVANLGTVNLAAGKQAVLTFDNGGLLGVRVSQEILQSELGIDPAVVNSGEIQAQGGRVLLTASVSQEVFSRAVNTAGIDQATSVVVNDDGTFALGGGAGVLNSGTINTSTTSTDQNVGRIVLIGENVTSSGTIKADAANGNGGEIELHARDMALLTKTSMTTARAETNGKGGIVKVLGDKVGLFDQATVDVSGAHGGGQALIGGDFQGKNAAIRNATTTLVDRNTRIVADALQNGDGGKVIVWADGTTQFLGNIFTRGGATTGNGGFVETSGKNYLLFDGMADRTAAHGSNGTLLLDPDDITISGGGTPNDNNLLANSGTTTPTVAFATSAGSDITITNTRLVQSLALGTVELQARRDVIIDGPVDASANAQTYTAGNPTNNNLVLRAGDDVNINSPVNLNGGNFTMTSGVASCPGSSCLPDNPTAPNVVINGTINTTGAITINSAEQVTINRAIGGTSAPASVTIRAGSGILVDATGNTGSITASGNASLTAADATLVTDNITIAATSPASLNIIIEGDITTNSGTGNGTFTARTDSGFFNNIFTGQNINTGSGNVMITTGGSSGASLGDITTTGTGSLTVTTTAGQITQSTDAAQNLAIGGAATFDAGTNAINLQNTSNAIVGPITLGPAAGGGGAVTLNNSSIATLLGVVRATTLTVNAGRDLTLSGNVTTTGTTDFNFGSGGGSIFTVSPGITLTTGPLTIDGGTNADTFNIGSSISGTVNGNDSADTFNIGSSILGTVNGGDGADRFNMTAPGVSIANLNGGTGTDTLAGYDQTNTWQITAANAGTLNNSNIAFSQIENLAGGTGDDTFTFNVDPGTAGLAIDGGAHTTRDTVALGAAMTGATLVAGQFTNIERYQGNVNGNTLQGGGGANAWSISGANSGTVNGIDFIDFPALLGGSGTDNFTFVGTGAVAGIATPSTPGIDGNGGNNSVTGPDGVNTWTITGQNAGSVNANTFRNIQSLNGGNNTDTFTFNTGGSLVNGVIDGGTGTNTLNMALLTSVEVTLAPTTTTGALRVSNIATLTGNNTASTLTGDNTPSTWMLTGQNDGAVNSISFFDFNNLVGGTNTDNFTYTATGSLTGYVDGGAGTDSVNLAALPGPVTVTLDATGATGYRNIEQFTGNTTASTLQGDHLANAWAITGANSGTVNSLSANGVTFTGFNNLIGGNAADTFTFGAGGSLTGYVDGGIGAGADSVSLASLATVDVTLGAAGAYRNIEQFTGNNTASTLRGSDNTTNTWNLTGPNDGNVNGTIFVDFNNLVGGTGTDTFNVSTTGQLTGLINGGADPGANTLSILLSTADTLVRLLDAAPVAPVNNPAGTLTVYQVGTLNGNSNASHTLAPEVSNTSTTTSAWTVSGVNSGTVNFGPIASFTGFRNLTGTTANDTFTLVSTAAEPVTGLINGGGQSGGEDVLILGSAAIAVRLGDAATAGELNVSGIERIQGNITSTLIADNGTNDWAITGANDGTVRLNAGTTNDLVAFSDFNTLRGGGGNDNFQILFNSALSANIAGGGQATRDTIDYSAQGAVVVNFGPGAFNGITEIEAVRGNGTNSTLNGPTSGNASWTVTGVNTGSVADSSATMGFEGFNYLVGGSGNDTFAITGGSLWNAVTTVPGLIQGGGGTNTVNVDLTGAGTSSGQINYVGSASNTDTININNTSPNAYAGTYTPVVSTVDPNNAANSGAYEQLSYRYANPAAGTDSALAFNYRNVGTVRSQLRVGTFTVNGSGVDETIQLGNGTFTVGAFTPVNYANATHVTVNGQAGSDTINLNNVNIGGTLALTANAVTGDTLTANTLILDNVGQFGTSTGLITTTLDTLQLVNAGPVYINETNGLNLNTAGTVTNAGVFNIAGLTHIDAGGGSLTLDNAANDFDTVNVSNAASIHLRDGDRIDGGDITADNVTLATATGVGSPTGRLQTHTANLTITNATGGVNVNNSQPVQVRITNQGDINFSNAGNVVVDRLYTHGDAYDAATGNVELTTTGGAVYAYTGTGSHSAIEAPDIVANELLVNIRGDLGSPVRSMSIRVPTRFSFFGARGYVFYYGGPPRTIIGAEDLVVFSGLAGLSNQQLIEVESLGEFDPAIFTAIRNYYYEDVAIMMPADQRLDGPDEDEDKEEEEEKR